MIALHVLLLARQTHGHREASRAAASTQTLCGKSASRAWLADRPSHGWPWPSGRIPRRNASERSRWPAAIRPQLGAIVPHCREKRNEPAARNVSKARSVSKGGPEMDNASRTVLMISAAVVAGGLMEGTAN